MKQFELAFESPNNRTLARVINAELQRLNIPVPPGAAQTGTKRLT